MKTFSLRPCIAELIGTFLLAFGVGASILISNFPIVTPIVAGLVLGLMVYTIGATSGAHINPAVTIAIYSMRKISLSQACGYIVAQLVGGYLALLLLQRAVGMPTLIGQATLPTLLSEAAGAFILFWGIASVVSGKVHEAAVGITIGGSLTLGAMMAVGSYGMLNPAVAIGNGIFSLTYTLGPIIGTLVAAQVYQWVIKSK
jgi:aquaporin Z